MRPADQPPPVTSNLNVLPGPTVANLAVVKLGSDGLLLVANNRSFVHVIAVRVGYYRTVGTGFVALAPSRVLDTRDGTGAPASSLSGGEVVTVDLDGVGGLPTSGVAAVAMDLTAIGGSSSPHITARPTSQAFPDSSNLNVAAGMVVPNLVVIATGGNGSQISFFNSYGSSGGVHLIGDLVGHYV